MAIVINSTNGEIDLDASTAGTYTVTYTVQGVSSNQQVTINDLDNAAFAYSASSYAPTDADPTPTITGLTGGTFSGTTGLVINSTTGEIDLSASTIATHTITYNTSSSGSSVCPNTSTQTVEIAVAGIANNYSMNFDGINDYIYINNPDLTSTTYSLSLWFKSTDTSVNVLSEKIPDTGSAYAYRIYLYGNGNLELLGTQTSGTAYNDGNWHHVVIVQDPSLSSGQSKGYVDGNLVTQNNSSSNTSGSNNLYIGCRNGSQYFFNGQIDEVAIWNTALTSTQVSEIYNATGTNLTKDLTTVSGSNLKYWNRMGD